MTDKQMFRKKKVQDSNEDPKEKAIKPAENKTKTTEATEEKTTKEETEQADTPPKRNKFLKYDDTDETVRLSCDIPKQFHNALRIAAAHCDRSITDMLDTLIECHLVHCEIQSIVNSYHKKVEKTIRLK